jgi:polar amino acid transport system substrate-binding protein
VMHARTGPRRTAILSLTSLALAALLTIVGAGAVFAQSPSPSPAVPAVSPAASPCPSVAPAASVDPAASPGPSSSPCEPASLPVISAECLASAIATKNPGRLTIGTDNPAYPPWWGGTPPAGSEWSNGYPPSGQGFEGAIAYAVAHALGYTDDQVDWTQMVYTDAYKPGPKDFDYYLAQLSYKPKRALTSDFSDSYYDVNQAIVALSSNPIAAVTTITGLKDFTLGAPEGSTSYDTIVNVVAPNKDPQVFPGLAKGVRALKNGQIDGLVVDLPSTGYMTSVQLAGKGVVVGQFPAAGHGEHFGIVLPKGSAMTGCVNEALALIKANGTWQSIYDQWLAGVGGAPFFQP